MYLAPQVRCARGIQFVQLSQDSRQNHWLRILAYITGTVDQENLLRNEYLAAENRILIRSLRLRIMRQCLTPGPRPRVIFWRKLNAVERSSISCKLLDDLY